MSDEKLDELKEQYYQLDKKLEIVSNTLERHFEEDARNMDRINIALEKIDGHLYEYNRELNIHIQGTIEVRKQNELLYEQVQLTKKTLELKMSEITKINEEQNKQIIDLNKPKIVIKGILWIVGALTAISSLIFTVTRLFDISF